LDSDDVYLLTDGLAQLMALAQAEQPDVLLFQAVDVYPHHQTVRKAYDVEYMATHSGVGVFAQLVRTQSFNMSACFQLIRRELLEQHQLYFEKGLLSEDVDWSLRLWKHVSKVRAINLPLYGYQHREGSISTTYTIRNLRSYEHIFAKFVQLYKERVVEAFAELYWQTVMGYLAQMYTSCLYAYGQIARKDKSEAYAILKRYATLLEHSISLKSDRVIKFKRVLGDRMTVCLFALYGKIRRFKSRV
jgi:GT2 family glycosyltransferase